MKTIYFFLFLFLFSCIYETDDDRLKIVNKTNYEFSLNYNLKDTIPEYPSVNHTEYYSENLVNVGDTVSVSEEQWKTWPSVIGNSRTKKLNLFIYSNDSLKKYKEIDILIKRKIYKRLEYSVSELEKKNWTVVVK